jgi:hypothetical protein
VIDADASDSLQILTEKVQHGWFPGVEIEPSDGNGFTPRPSDWATECFEMVLCQQFLFRDGFWTGTAIRIVAFVASDMDTIEIELRIENA